MEQGVPVVFQPTLHTYRSDPVSEIRFWHKSFLNNSVVGEKVQFTGISNVFSLLQVVCAGQVIIRVKVIDCPFQRICNFTLSILIRTGIEKIPNLAADKFSAVLTAHRKKFLIALSQSQIAGGSVNHLFQQGNAESASDIGSKLQNGFQLGSEFPHMRNAIR
ncbi:hypothetical protein SDC9_61108 [bioreactor metagenome]|uniref:Uncharacterized protein n=1 Tax=bioreactor metagenome TaxID=1076179 RepID=A0A644XKY6_9ZZZZ